MILVAKNEKESIQNIIDFLEKTKETSEVGLINFTVEPCKVKSYLLNIAFPFEVEDKNDYVIVVDFAVYNPKVKEGENDSPGAKFIDYNEHLFNVNKIVNKLKDFQGKL